MALLHRKIINAHRPFRWQGVSVYAGSGLARYRDGRIIGGTTLMPTVRIGREKTARIASEAGTGELEVTAAVPEALIDNPAVAFDVRHYRDDCECEVTAPQLATIDSGGDDVEAIGGRALYIRTDVRTGGRATIFFRFIAGAFDRPFRFRIEFTAGPTSPADITTLYAGPKLYDVPASGLSSGTYTFTLTAENQAETVSVTLLTGIQFTVDADGPDAVTGVTVEVR